MPQPRRWITLRKARSKARSLLSGEVNAQPRCDLAGRDPPKPKLSRDGIWPFARSSADRQGVRPRIRRFRSLAGGMVGGVHPALWMGGMPICSQSPCSLHRGARSERQELPSGGTRSPTKPGTQNLLLGALREAQEGL
jgi:hypothetical protein